MSEALTRQELEAAHCWEEVDRVPRQPGLDLAYIGSLVALDAAFVLDLGDGTKGIISLDTKYHERIKPIRLPRYLEVTEKSGVFGPQVIDAVNGTDLLVMWLEHLLLFSMLQHVNGDWSWGRYVVVHPAGNLSIAEGCARYRDLLVDQSAFSSITLEDLLDAGVLPAQTAAALLGRYILN
ncbi:MAG TPA: hypothetical protein VI980_03020 [Acidimicrobiia bacterium]|nr:hypothetical protein [Acidimicrobiia bacterium]